jgi:membrane protease YdiL (CAAX protease family)
MSRDALPWAVKLVGWSGAALFWVVLLGLRLGAGVPLSDAILVAALLVAVPAFATAQLRVIPTVRVERLPAYWGSIAALWLIGSAAWLVGTRRGGPESLGLVVTSTASLAGWTVGLTLGGLLVIVGFREIAIRWGCRESPVLREILPRTPREKGVFALLSVAAGVSEELAYRGYAIPVLAPLLGTWGGVALTSVIFGVLHAYQGWLGTARTALMGGVLAWGFLASGSLWPAILAHTAIDLVAGIVLGERLLPPVGPGGVVVAPGAWSHERTR